MRRWSISSEYRIFALLHQLEQLNSSREQLSLITENMSEGLMIIGRKSTVLSCNSAAIRLLGNPNFKEGQSVYALNNSETFRRCIMNALGGVRSECILRADGGEREVIASPASGTGALCGIVVFVMDVTERQQLETMRREFTSNVSHELKTPLTTIYGISDMLAGGMVDPRGRSTIRGGYQDRGGQNDHADKRYHLALQA